MTKSQKSQQGVKRKRWYYCIWVTRCKEVPQRLTLPIFIYIGSGIGVIWNPDLPRPSAKRSEIWILGKQGFLFSHDINQRIWQINLLFFVRFCFPFVIVTGLSGTLPGHLRWRNSLGIINDVIHGVYGGLGTIRWEPTHCLWHGYLRRATAVQIRDVEVSGEKKKNQFGKKKKWLSIAPNRRFWHKFANQIYNNKQLLDEVFVISGIIKVEVSVISRSRRLRLITLSGTLIISDVTKTESHNCLIHSLFSTSHFLTWTWHCSWKSCIAHTTYGLFTNPLAD